MKIDYQHFQLVTIDNSQDFAPYAESFAKAFQSVFTSPPYHEQFLLSEALAIMEFHLDTRQRWTMLAFLDDEVVGFGLGCALRNYPEISRHIHGLLPPKYTHYFAELGVVPEHRQQGLGKQITQRYLDWVDEQPYNHVLMRISDTPSLANQMFIDMGFEDIGVSMEIASRRVDGSFQKDRRLFLSRLIQTA